MTSKIRILMAAIVIMGMILSCNLPGLGSNTEQQFPTPNRTMTELFAMATLLTPAFPQEMTVTLSPAAPTSTATILPSSSPTITLTPTTPPTSTLTPVPLPARYAGYFVAPYLAHAPTIDGNWDDWSTVEYPIGNVVYGANSWSGNSDLEGAFRIGWDYNYLYIAVKVKDDVYAQNATGQDIYKGDSLEVLFDANLYGDFYVASLDGDDYQLGIAPGRPDTNGPKEAIIWYPRAGNGSRSSVIIGAVGGSGLYRVEAAIPWSVLGVSAPGVNYHYGFAMSISDNDDTTANVQQSMVSNISGRRLTNPTTWGELILGN